MPDQPTRYHLFGNILQLRAQPSAGAAFLLSECTTMPGAGAPPNCHPGDDEAFYVLEGRYDFTVDGVAIQAKPGDWVPIPNGAPHDFRNPTGQVARMLVLNWPGRQHEAFFTTLGEVLPDGGVPPSAAPPPEAALAELRRRAAACGVELLA